MTFWLNVTVAYAVTIAAGLALGRYLATRFRGRGGHGGTGAPVPAPTPGPTHALEVCPPLGSAFDRAFLPAAFDDVPAAL